MYVNTWWNDVVRIGTSIKGLSQLIGRSGFVRRVARIQQTRLIQTTSNVTFIDMYCMVLYKYA